MANSRDKVILVDGWRNAVVRLSGILDSSDESWNQCVTLLDFTNNDQRAGLLVGFRLDNADYSITDPLSVILTWDGDSPQAMATLAQSEDMDFQKVGGLRPDRTRSGYNGALNLSTRGFVPGNPKTYSLGLRLIKLYA